MRGAGRLVVFLSLVVISLSFSSSVFAATISDGTVPPLSISTELPLYDAGDTVTFSGFIKSPDVNNLTDVTVRVIGPLVDGSSSNIVQIKQVRPSLDGSFEGTFVVGGPLWTKQGDYKILVNYGPQKAETKFFYNGGTGGEELDVRPPLPKCGTGQVLVNGQCVDEDVESPTQCGSGTVYDKATDTCVVAPPVDIDCPPGQTLVNGQCIDEPPDVMSPTKCGPGTHPDEKGICVPDTKPPTGQCAIATAAFGTELAPQVQMLREIRDNVLFSTGSGTVFMVQFNDFYYTFSPTIADWERQSPLFKELVKGTITPMLSTLSILNYVEIDSESEMLGYGIGIILMNVGMYFVAPALIIIKVKGLIQKRRL